MARTLLKCFIAAPSNAHIGPLRDVLARRGVEITESGHVDDAILWFPDVMEQSISEADFMCLVLTEDYRAPGLWLATGYALAKKLPILVFAASDVDFQPITDQWNLVRAPLSNRDALNLHLDAFIRTLRPSHKKVSKKGKSEKSPKTDLTWASDELAKVRQLQPVMPRAMAFEQLVARVFEAAGLSAITSPAQEKHRVDLALWVDEFRSNAFNPLYVEVKMGDLSESQLQDAEGQLRSFIASSHGGVGLIVYLDSRGREFTKPTPTRFPIVVWKSISTLIEEVEKGTFVKSLQSERNKAAHS